MRTCSQRNGAEQTSAAMQSAPYGLRDFRVEITWRQFQGVLRSVTAGDPAPVFGDSWSVPENWVLLRAGYGQENFNNSSSTSTIEGYFTSLEVVSLGTATPAAPDAYPGPAHSFHGLRVVPLSAASAARYPS